MFRFVRFGVGGHGAITDRDANKMMIADITLAAFTLCNSLRVVAYVPQIAKALRDRSGAEAISFGTWSLFLVSHASAMAYAFVNKQDWTMASMFLFNAIGCCVILLVAGWKRARHRSLDEEKVRDCGGAVRWMAGWPGRPRRTRVPLRLSNGNRGTSRKAIGTKDSIS
jgi:hypothetical protein